MNRTDCTGDAAELINAAHDVLATWHGWQAPNGEPDRDAAYRVLTEWADWPQARPVHTTCAEVELFYHAALGLLARFYGIDDLAEFRRYLRTRRKGTADARG
jgi:hypothetical protein